MPGIVSNIAAEDAGLNLEGSAELNNGAEAACQNDVAMGTASKSLSKHLTWSTMKGYYLEKRFCKQFSESSPCLPGQQESCNTTLELLETLQVTAQRGYNSSLTFPNYSRSLPDNNFSFRLPLNLS